MSKPKLGEAAFTVIVPDGVMERVKIAAVKQKMTLRAYFEALVTEAHPADDGASRPRARRARKRKR